MADETRNFVFFSSWFSQVSLPIKNSAAKKKHYSTISANTKKTPRQQAKPLNKAKTKHIA
jgi:hypothetical protein